MFNPSQIHKAFHPPTIPLIKNANHIVLDNITSHKTKWDQPIEIPPVLYSKFNVPVPGSTSKPNQKQHKSYPKQLLDYIKRSYQKCKDENQKVIMEKHLRQIVRNFENDFNQVNWDTYPTPNVQDTTSLKPTPVRTQFVNPLHKSKLSQIKLPSSYNIIQEEKPSKAMQIAKKKLEKLQQKFNRPKKQEQQQVQPQKQIFIGFSSAPPPQPKQIPRFQMTVPFSPSAPLANRVISNPSPFNPPVIKPNPLLTQTLTSTGLIDKQSTTAKILKYQISQKPIQKLKEKDRVKEREREREKEKEITREKEKEREREREKQRQREKEKQRQKQKQKQKQRKLQPEKTKQIKKQKQKVEQKTKQQQKSPAIAKKATKKQLQLIQKHKQKQQQLDQIAKRFKDFYKMKNDNYQKDAIQEDNQDIDFQQVIVGKNQSIEKPYLRITGRPNPDTVRPEPVLKKALEHFLKKYKNDGNYEYLISQLRSIRQDLTVQHIKNSFTVQVYEQNLEISLYQKDIPQFKHCQTTLWQLYSQGHLFSEASRSRFVAHQMTTLIMEDKSQQMEFMMTKVPEHVLETPQVQSCLKLKRILLLGNYTKFFAYFHSQQKFVKSLLQQYIQKMYVRFLLMICKTCGQKVPVSTIAKLVGQSQGKILGIIKAENGVVKDGFLMLKPSYESFLKSQHLIIKKVTVLLG